MWQLSVVFCGLFSSLAQRNACNCSVLAYTRTKKVARPRIASHKLCPKLQSISYSSPCLPFFLFLCFLCSSVLARSSSAEMMTDEFSWDISGFARGCGYLSAHGKACSWEVFISGEKPKWFWIHIVPELQSAIFPFAPEKSVPGEVLILISQPESKTTNSGMFFLKIFKIDMEVTDIFWRESKLN